MENFNTYYIMKNYYDKQIRTFYTQKQVCFSGIRERSYSQSPLKPYLLMKKIKEGQFSSMLRTVSNFKPYEREDFYIAHTKKYVKDVFTGKGKCESNGLPWSENLVESLTYTNSALHNAVEYAFLNPSTVTFAPISGMHHARPNSGCGFCTFSGQVISAIKMYQEFGATGAYLDLDGHFGNSIEDARDFNPLINEAVPVGYNVNPKGTNEEYVRDFDEALSRIGYQVIKGNIEYVVFCHGADSHEDDDLRGHLNTECWLKCATIFAKWVNEVSSFLGRPFPVILTLFGGYRRDDYDAVLNLHTKSLIQISNIICGNHYVDNLEVSQKKREKYNFKDMEVVC